MQKNESAKSSAKEIVMEFMQAWERKDWKTVRSHISDNISVLAPGPFKQNTFHQAEAYMYYLEHSDYYPKRDIKKVISDGKDVCLLFEMTYREPPPPLTTFLCGLFHVNDDDDDGDDNDEDGKIDSLRIVLDPRELFQKYFKRYRRQVGYHMSTVSDAPARKFFRQIQKTIPCYYYYIDE